MVRRCTFQVGTNSFFGFSVLFLGRISVEIELLLFGLYILVLCRGDATRDDLG